MILKLIKKTLVFHGYLCYAEQTNSGGNMFNCCEHCGDFEIGFPPNDHDTDCEICIDDLLCHQNE